jgi:formate/nitrite transporter FocA (FNT family)
MAERAERAGVEKTRLDTTGLMALAVIAGAFVAFGSMFSVVVSAGAEGLLGTLTNLLWVTLGNMIGGMIVGITYWFIYLRKAARAPH